MVVGVSVSVTSRRATTTFLSAVVLLVLQPVYSQGQDASVSSSYGTDFYIGFMRNLGGQHRYTILQLVIGTTAESAKYVVETNNTVQIGTVSSGTPVVVTIPSDENLQVTGNDFDNRQKGVHVYTTGDEPIFVLAENYITQINYGTYLAYPCIKTQSDTGKYEYYVISTDDLSNVVHSQFLLVGCEDDTTITITPTQSVSIPQDPQMETTKSVTVDSSTTSHSFTLHQMQTLLVSSVDDLTGTKIVSDKPLTVISGHECADIPSSSYACEPLSIHVPPSTTWGTEFLLAPFAGKDGEQLFKLVSAEPTTVVYTCGMISHRNKSVTSLLIKTKDYCYLESSKPLLVAQFSNEEDKGDPAIAMISPVDQYVSEIAFFSLPMVNFPSNYISVTVSTEHYEPESILLNDAAIDCEWTEIGNDEDEIVGYGCSTEVTSGINSPMEYMVSHMDVDGLISVLVYGFNEVPGRGYAYLAGKNLFASKPPPPPTTMEIPTPTVTSTTMEIPTPTVTATTMEIPTSTMITTTMEIPTPTVTTTIPTPTMTPTPPDKRQTCPPDCTFEYCNGVFTRTNPCTIPNPQSKCDLNCTITDCRACYYADTHLPVPEQCNSKACSTYPNVDDPGDVHCLKLWAVCVRRTRPTVGEQTPERFKCFKHPCV